MTDEKWLPDDRPWIEHTGMTMPAGITPRIEVLFKGERDRKGYTPMVVPAKTAKWDHPKGHRGAIAAYLPVTQPDVLVPSRSTRVRHVKRGSMYTVVCNDARIQISGRIEDGDTVVVYRSDDGKTYVRSVKEMDDGRFVVED